MSPGATSTHFLNPSRDGDSTTALGSLVQCLTALSAKKCFLISNALHFYKLGNDLGSDEDAHAVGYPAAEQLQRGANSSGPQSHRPSQPNVSQCPAACCRGMVLHQQTPSTALSEAFMSQCTNLTSEREEADTHKLNLYFSHVERLQLSISESL